MRFTPRKIVQLVVLVSCLVCISVFYQVNKANNGESSLHYGRRTNFIEESAEVVVDNIDIGKSFEGPLRRRQRSAKGVLEGLVDRRSAEWVQIARSEAIRKVKKSKHRTTALEDIFISVKTTQKYHNTRLKLLLDTWVVMAKEQTYFFTDSDDPELQKKTNGHMINTNCSGQHNRQALCCKMAQEYDYFLESMKRWFCHVDDDTYVNVPELVHLLQAYNHTGDWYLGKPSLKHPIEIVDRENPGIKLAFWFATGGAGFCISRSLALKMVPHASGGRLMTVGDKIRLPDDCTVGYIIHYLLNKRLTVLPQFHSHLEALWLLKDDLSNQVTFSYSHYGDKINVVDVQGFDPDQDPTRFNSIHCQLFPYLANCEKLWKSM